LTYWKLPRDRVIGSSFLVSRNDTRTVYSVDNNHCYIHTYFCNAAITLERSLPYSPVEIWQEIRVVRDETRTVAILGAPVQAKFHQRLRLALIVSFDR
jgi:hypothetical protein